ncbi:MAG: esterase/lipase family protein, partial [Fidelibacterota bacterium]
MKRLVFLLLATTVLVNGQSTMRQGLFLHGYGSSGESWINTGTPTALEDEGVFTETISPDLPGLNHLDELATVINPLLNDAQNDDWIFIGHSLGGLMAKYLESATRDGNPDIYDLANLKGVLTLGAPFQGAPVADFEGNNTQEVVDHFRNDVRAGPDWQVDWGWTSLDIVEVLISAYGWVGGQLYQDFSDILDDLHSDLSNMIETAAGLNANSY